MDNAVFEKTMENLQELQNFELVNDGRRLRRLTSKPNSYSFKIFSEDLVGVRILTSEVRLVKPTYVGMSICDFPTLFMYTFYHEKMRSKYSDRATLLMTDTYCLVYRIQTYDLRTCLQICWKTLMLTTRVTTIATILLTATRTKKCLAR